jgi:uncharacterized Zn finger protein
MTRESADSKGRRYLTEGRLTLTFVEGDRVAAYCRGDGELYEVGHDPAQGWFCSCAARSDCAHLVALRLVTVRTSRLRLAASRRAA